MKLQATHPVGTSSEEMAAALGGHVVRLHSGSSAVFNPAASAGAEELQALVLAMVGSDATVAELADMTDRAEALIPALVELRDGGHLALSFRTICDYDNLDSYCALAADERLSWLARHNCEAIRNRIVVQGVKRLLGHDNSKE